MARGNQKQQTFMESLDFLKYLDLLQHYKKEYLRRSPVEVFVALMVPLGNSMAIFALK